MGVIDGLSYKIEGEEIAEARKILGHFVLTREAYHHFGNIEIRMNELMHIVKLKLI